MCADIFTKALTDPVKWEHACQLINIGDPTNLWERLQRSPDPAQVDGGNSPPNSEDNAHACTPVELQAHNPDEDVSDTAYPAGHLNPGAAARPVGTVTDTAHPPQNPKTP